MGFEKTTDGRIFFQAPRLSDDDDAQDNVTPITLDRVTPIIVSSDAEAPAQESDADVAEPTKEEPKRDDRPVIDGATQIQMLQLLKSLNEKLGRTKNDRDQMRAELTAAQKKLTKLEGQTRLTDEQFGEILKQAEHHKHVSIELSRKQAALEKQQKSENVAALTARMDQSDVRQQALDEKVNSALNQQARLMRKLEQAMEERARFMRKIERMEQKLLASRDQQALPAETTRELSATQDQPHDVLEASAQKPAEVMAHAPQITDDRGRQAQLPKWLRPTGISIPALAIICLAAAVAGWMVSDAQKMRQFDMLPPQEETPVISSVSIPPKEEAAIAPASPVNDEPNSADQANMPAPQGWSKEVDLGAFILSDDVALETLTIGDIDTEITPSPTVDQVNQANNDAATQPQALKETDIAPAAPQEEKSPALAQPRVNDVYAFPKDANLPEIMHVIEDRAYGGDAEAQHDLAAVYAAGHGGIAQDYARAAYWFEQSATGGIANAAYNLGVLYHQGLGVDANIAQALSWYRRAADLKHPEAQYNLGIAYIEGIGTGYDPVKAADYFHQAARQGVVEAAYNLGLVYENGLLGASKPQEALRWYKKAADHGSVEAQAALKSLAKALDIPLTEVNWIASNIEKIENGEVAQYLDFADKNVPSQATKNLTAQVQNLLKNAGLYAGPADGVRGPMTLDAVRSYQAIHNLDITGDIDQGLLEHMLGTAGSPLVPQ